MIYTDVFLRAETEADLKAALPWALYGEDAPQPMEGEDPPSISPDDWRTNVPFEYALDLIGPLTVALL